jgi:hypothetical protein
MHFFIEVIHFKYLKTEFICLFAISFILLNFRSILTIVIFLDKASLIFLEFHASFSTFHEVSRLFLIYLKVFLDCFNDPLDFFNIFHDIFDS